MAGLAIGSAYLGKWSEQYASPVTLYARIEFLVAVTAALSIAGLAAVRALYVSAYPVTGGSQPLLIALRFVGTTVVLFVPTFLMGGTFPVLVSAVVSDSAQLGVRVSQLYWVNTLGAVAGTLFCGFVLLPTFGLRLTIVCGAAINTMAALIAIRLAKETSVAVGVAPSKAISADLGFQKATPQFLLFLFAIVGCTAFAYEIALARLLAITLGSSTYAFTLMLATFLAGTVIGSMLFQRFVAISSRISIRTLSRTQLGLGTAAVLSLILFHWIPALIPILLRSTDQTFGGLVLAQSVTSALTLVPLATVFGFNFPLFLALLDRGANDRSTRAATIGRAYAANTLGAIVGSVITGFWLVPFLGSFRAIAAAAALNVLLALVLDLRQQRRVLPLSLDLACLVAVLAIATSGFFCNQSLLSFSAALYGNSYEGRLTLDEIAATKDLVFSAEGINNSIAVVRTDNDVALRVNGKVDASTDDAQTQLLLGHLGTAFHAAPKRVLIIGFGSGMTASAVARYPDVAKIDCVEIEPAVIRAAPYLQSLNRGVLKDARLHLIIDDARNFLLTTREKYDLIISEPSNPWIAGVATLFTNEFYTAARARLAPGGLFVQWVQAYSIAPDDLRMIAASFAPHFSDVTVWRAGETDLLLLGRIDATPLRFDHFRSLWENKALRADFEAIDVHQPEGLTAYFLLDDGAVRKLAEGSTLNTDDRTLLEYHAPRSLLERSMIDADQKLIAELRSGPLPDKLDPTEVQRALEAGVSTALDINDVANAKRFLATLASQPESASRYIAQGRLEIIEDALPTAKASLEAALRLDADSLDAMHWLAIAEHRSGEDDSARLRIREILKRNPRFLPAIDDEMQFAISRKDFRTAVSAQLTRVAVMRDPPASEYCRLGLIWLSLSNLAEAESDLLKGILKDPYSYACHVGLGQLYWRNGRLPQARDNFEWVVRFFPDTDVSTFTSLAAIYNALDDKKNALSTLHKGSRLFPDNGELRKVESLLVQ
jgi:predicted membrane-bound spermidine synthase/tetratricopeptide (TPR) repeat protein